MKQAEELRKGDRLDDGKLYAKEISGGPWRCWLAFTMQIPINNLASPQRQTLNWLDTGVHTSPAHRVAAAWFCFKPDFWSIITSMKALFKEETHFISWQFKLKDQQRISWGNGYRSLVFGCICGKVLDRYSVIRPLTRIAVCVETWAVNVKSNLAASNLISLSCWSYLL